MDRLAVVNWCRICADEQSLLASEVPLLSSTHKACVTHVRFATLGWQLRIDDYMNLRTFIVLVLIVGSAEADEPWQRVWTVECIFCPSCDAEVFAGMQHAVGQNITMAPDRFENPLYESCLRGVDYSDLKPRRLAEAEASLMPGRLPSMLHDTVVAGTVRCSELVGAPNAVARFIFDETEGYYLFEDGAILVLGTDAE
jgi:hypothetical protein